MLCKDKVSIKIGPSILNSDLSQLNSECTNLVNSGADYLHLDVMDGHFVPNITFGHPVVECLRPKLPNVFFDMHMMVMNPENWIKPMFKAGANLYTFHLEATKDPMDCIRRIKESGMKAGVGIKPGTPVEQVFPFINDVDMVLVMTVEPGFGGQSFMKEMMPKVKLLRKNFKDINIEVDGGVNLSNIRDCYEAGANMIVSGSAVVKNKDPGSVISEMKRISEEIAW